MTTPTAGRIVRAGAVALLLLGCAEGCSRPFRPAISSPSVASEPTPDSPQNVVRLLGWCWIQRDIVTCGRVFTDDFRFVFALGDSAGNPFRDDPVTREMELSIARHLFVGGGTAAPATGISLTLDPTLRALPDSRPGRDPRWHKVIVTSVDLAIATEDGAEYRIQGNARFFAVRGDSALIPSDLGVGPDSTRWYVERWEDETLDGTGALPGTLTWGQLKALYR